MNFINYIKDNKTEEGGPGECLVLLSRFVVEKINERWHAEGGFRELLILALPLILSTGSWSVQLFVDRMFLTWYSPAAIAASVPAGILNFTLLSLFLGTATYVSTFVAQYYGAKKFKKIGPIVWQGIYISFFAGIFHLLIIPLAPDIFNLINHEPRVMQNEIIYFQVLCTGAFPMVASSAASSLYSGMGRTMTIMKVTLSATLINIIMDYCLIFGKFGLPSMGIKGAGIATVISSCYSLAVYAFLITRPSMNKSFNTVKSWRISRPLISRLLKFGLPSGIQFFLDISGMTFFILMIGRLGTTKLAASNIAFNINTLAFMPMIGTAIAVSVMVGQYLGKNRPEIARYSAFSGFYLTFLYMGSVALLYVFSPGIFLAPFASQADPETFKKIREITIILLKFVAFYSIFDTLHLIFASAIKGAGDTRFVMYVMLLATSFVLIIPSYIALDVLGMGIYTGWTIAALFITTIGIIFLLRFLGGKWKDMRVIEEEPETLS